MFNGYRDSQIHGVVGCGGKLNIRSKFQREFVYKDAQRDAVIDTVMKNPQSRMIGIVAINVYNNEKIEFKSYTEAENMVIITIVLKDVSTANKGRIKTISGF